MEITGNQTSQKVGCIYFANEYNLKFKCHNLSRWIQFDLLQTFECTCHHFSTYWMTCCFLTSKKSQTTNNENYWVRWFIVGPLNSALSCTSWHHETLVLQTLTLFLWHYMPIAGLRFCFIIYHCFMNFFIVSQNYSLWVMSIKWL